MAFDSLSERLQGTIKKFSGQGRLTEKNMEDMLSEIRLALLEADVNYQVVKEFIAATKEKNVDVLICDTAGRLQNKVNLMKELEKMNRIIKREIPDAPQETLLVIDATTGQNGVSQAIEFSKITDVTGIVLTKMDGTAKGGIVLSIKDQLNIPVKFIGLGESVDDLQEFDLEQYIYGLCKNLVEA